MPRAQIIKLLKIALISLFALIIISYAISRSLDYARGPEIEIISPSDGSATSSPIISIIGRALRVSNIALNGKAITIDESGYFNEPIIIFHGMNIETFTASDQFGRSVKRKIRMVEIE